MTQVLSNAWRTTFPVDETEDVIKYLTESWNELRLLPGGANALSARRNETKITNFFGQYLSDRAQEWGLSGLFLYERPHANVDLERGELSSRIRTDIEYVFVGASAQPLVFEFKKLCASKETRASDKAHSRKRRADCKHYCGDNGMRRFVIGDYIKYSPYIAFMVGMVDDQADVRSIVEALKIASPLAQALNGIPDAKGELVREPSEIFPRLVRFDTVHSRSNGGDLANLTLMHLFLHFPELEAGFQAGNPIAG